MCIAGWSGTDCRTNDDDCVDNNCENDAKCVDMLDAYACIGHARPVETTPWNPTPPSPSVTVTYIDTSTGYYADTTAQITPPGSANNGNIGEVTRSRQRINLVVSRFS